MINIRKEITIALIGAATGAFITFLVSSWSESKNNLEQANLKNLIVDAKEETLEVVKDLLIEVGKERGELKIITSESKKNALYISSQKNKVEDIIANLKQKTSLTDSDIRRIFEADIKTQIYSQIEKKLASCPNGMKNAGTFCIDYKYRFKKGFNWFQVNEGCIKKGLRMCSTSEISGAARLNIIKTYKFSDGNYWAWSNDVVLTKPEVKGVYDVCHVELNTNEKGYILGEWNCQVSAGDVNSGIVGMCCK